MVIHRAMGIAMQTSMVKKTAKGRTGNNFLDPFKVKGYVDWELIDDATGKVTKHGRAWSHSRLTRFLPDWIASRLPLGKENAIVNNARNQLANALIGTSVTYPEYIAIGTGTDSVAASDTALQTVSQYDGANDAKQAVSRTLKGQFTARIVAQFTTAQANVNIREVGLFEANDASQNMWARVNINVNKNETERLNIYWYLVFERRTGLAIKTGASIGATGTIVADTDSTLTFASSVTIVMITNNSGVKAYFKLNEALTGGASPTNYDFSLDNGEAYIQSDEEIEVSTIHVIMNDAFTMPDNELSVRGW
tara:strand:+ start:922 stop:1845 length:924 start_codon:yes stop_codon:yes gene_type:complete